MLLSTLRTLFNSSTLVLEINLYPIFHKKKRRNLALIQKSSASRKEYPFIYVWETTRQQNETRNTFSYPSVNRLAFHPHFPSESKENPFSIDERVISILRFRCISIGWGSRIEFLQILPSFFPNDKERGERNGFDYQRIKMVSISSPLFN